MDDDGHTNYKFNQWDFTAMKDPYYYYVSNNFAIPDPVIQKALALTGVDLTISTEEL